MKKSVTVPFDSSLYELIEEMAREERRSVPNFIVQFLSVSLDKNMDRKALAEKMNPAFNFQAAQQERTRLTKLLEASETK